jgi:hypothetical protein
MISKSKTLLFILSMATGLAAAQAAQRSFNFGISAASTDVKAGAPVIVKVQLKNTSDHDLSWMSLPGGNVHGEVVGFRPIVKDAQGKEPPLTKWGRQVFGRTAKGEPGLVLNAVGLVAVHPGDVMKTEIHLNEIYDLSAPGKYSVQVRYFDDENKDEVRSNAITVTVAP